MSRASTRVPTEGTAVCISDALTLIVDCIGVIYPFVLIFWSTRQPANPLGHIKIVTPEESIGPGVCSSPSHTFFSSLKLVELRAASEGTPCNIEQRRWHTDLC